MGLPAYRVEFTTSENRMSIFLETIKLSTQNDSEKQQFASIECSAKNKTPITGKIGQDKEIDSL
jgi:hypothetical protein